MISEKSFNSDVDSAGSAMVEQLHHDSKLEGLIKAGAGSRRDDIRKKVLIQRWAVLVAQW